MRPMPQAGSQTAPSNFSTANSRSLTQLGSTYQPAFSLAQMCAARGRRLGFRPDCTTRRPVVLFNRSRSGRGPTLALASPGLGGLEGDQAPTTDAHFGRSEPLVANFEIHALAEPMSRTKFGDRVGGDWYWRTANRRPLIARAGLALTVRRRLDCVWISARRPGSALRAIGGQVRFLAGDFRANHYRRPMRFHRGS